MASVLLWVGARERIAMDHILDIKNVIGLLLLAALAIAGIVRFRSVTKKKIRRKPIQDSIQDF